MLEATPNRHLNGCWDITPILTLILYPLRHHSTPVFIMNNDHSQENEHVCHTLYNDKIIITIFCFIMKYFIFPSIVIWSFAAHVIWNCMSVTGCRISVQAYVAFRISIEKTCDILIGLTLYFTLTFPPCSI